MRDLTKIEILKWLPTRVTETVFFDVHPWVTACAKEGKYHRNAVIQGPFRWGQQFAKFFWPAILLDRNEKIDAAALAKVERELGKQIAIFHYNAIPSFCRAWISLGVDHTCPHVDFLPNTVSRMAILHDTMPLDGYFGVPDRYLKGVYSNDTFLYVSNYAKEAFLQKQPTQNQKTFIFLPNTHGFSCNDIPWTGGSHDPYRSVSVSSIFERKNVFLTAEVAAAECCNHHHVGLVREVDREKWDDAMQNSMFEHLPEVSDVALYHVYQGAGLFLCLSSEEGFSMTPMEAMLAGVPKIILSDIPAHREVYGRYSVNFLDLKNPWSSPHTKMVTESDRLDLMDRYSLKRSIKPLLKHLSGVYDYTLHEKTL